MIHSDHDPSLSSDGLQCRQYGNRYPSLKCCKIPLIPNSIFLQIIKITQTVDWRSSISRIFQEKKKHLNTVFSLQCKSNHPWATIAHPHPFHQNAHPRYGSTTPLPRESHWSCIPPERFEGFWVEFSPFFAWISSCTMFYPFLVSCPFL